VCPDGELKNRKKNKMVVMRLGLATPKPASNVVVDLSPFFPTQEGSYSGSEQESTTCCSSPEQESAPGGSDEEALITSVIGCLGLEDTTEAGLGQKSSEARQGAKAPPNTPSFGSSAHIAGTCKPCAWFWKPSGCQNYDNCAYCHICSEGELKARKKSKNVAMRLGLVTPKPKSVSTSFGDMADMRYPLSLAACI